MLRYKIFFIVLLLIVLVLFRFTFTYFHEHNYQDAEQVSLSTLLLSDIDNATNNPSMTMYLPDSFPPQRVVIKFDSRANIHYGQTLYISGKLKKKVLKSGDVFWSIAFPKVAIASNWKDIFLEPLYSLRRKIIGNYQSVLSEKDSALLLGIVFGIKENIPKSFAQDLQATGVTHVIAASGMNVTMVAGFLIGLFSKILRRKIAIGISIGVLIVYAISAGLQPSIVRATIMGITVFASQLFGRQYKSWYILCLTAWCMLLLTPQLLFDIGFQLSFFSTLGIIYIQPLFKHSTLLTEDIVTTISAQIATVPILVNNFGQYGLLSILVNGLVLWTIPPLMIIGGLASILGLFIPVIGNIMLITAIPFLWFFQTIIGFFASLHWIISFSNKDFLLTTGYYFIVLAVIISIHNYNLKILHRKKAVSEELLSS